MRTRFVIHKNLLSQVFRVKPRHEIYEIDEWYPEDICVENPKRKNEGGYFILPKSEYVPCDSNGNVKDEHGFEAPAITDGGPEHASGTEADRQVPQVA